MSDFAGLLNRAKTTIGKKNPDLVYDSKKKVDWLPTGVLAFDLCSGGGIPRRRLTEFYGMEGSGKTGVSLSCLSTACATTMTNGRRGRAILIDVEGAYDPKLASRTYKLPEPNTENFALLQPLNGEEVCDFMDLLLDPKDTSSVDLIVIDSIDACKPQSIIDHSADEEQRVGAHPRLVGLLVGKLRQVAAKKNCGIIMINQMRAKISSGRSFEQNSGTAAGHNVNETHTTPGGYAPRFYSSLRFKFEYGGQIQEENVRNPVSGELEKARIGNEFKFINVKNRCSTPFIKVNGRFIFPTNKEANGWDNAGFLVGVLKNHGRISQRGTRFEYIGLNKNFSNIGSMASSEQKWASEPGMIEDATALLKGLISGGDLAPKTTAPIPEAILQIATPGIDYSVEDAQAASADPESLPEDPTVTLSLGSFPKAQDEVNPTGTVIL